MPMLDVQRRHQTVFRIRFGETQTIKSGKNKGKTFPAKLTDAIRVTSANPDVVDAFTAVYGGSREPWDGDKWEAKLPTTALRILVLPGQSISQWWELYKGSICVKRCDGHWETKRKQACSCSQSIDERMADTKQCSPTTRVSVICPDVGVVGSGMFVCHGLMGAETLPQSIAVAEAALQRGLMVPAVLRIVEYKGEATTWVVPQIEVVGLSFNELSAAAAQGALPAANEAVVVDGQGRRLEPGNRGFGAVPPRALVAPAPLEDQFAEFARETDAKEQQRQGRANAQAPIPATGVTVTQQGPSADPPPEDDVEVGEPAAGSTPPAAAGSPPPSDDAADRAHRRLMATLTELGQNDDATRHALCAWVSLGRTESSRLITRVELESVISAARMLAAGTHVLEVVTDEDPITRKPREHLTLMPHEGDPVNPGSLVLTPAGVADLKPREIADALMVRGLDPSGTVTDMRARLKRHLEEEPF